jgi:hypothetical protein
MFCGLLARRSSILCTVGNSLKAVLLRFGLVAHCAVSTECGDNPIRQRGTRKISLYSNYAW